MLENRILIVAPQWIGDAVMSLSLIQELAHTANNSPASNRTLDVLSAYWVADIYRHSPMIQNVIGAHFQHGAIQWSMRRNIARQQIAPQHYQACYVLPHSWKSALIPFLANIPKRIGYRGEWRYGLLNTIRRRTNTCHQAESYRLLSHDDHEHHKTDLIQEVPVCHYPHLTYNANIAQHIISSYGQSTKTPWLAFCPGAEYGPAKRWPASHFSQLAILLIEAGYHIMLLGSEKEQALAESIMNQLPKNAQKQTLSLCGKTTLSQAIDCLGFSKAAFVNDSGLMHIAAALQRPLFAFFGSSDAVRTGPLSPISQKHIFTAAALPCRPCLQRQCRFGHYRCLTEITPSQVARTFLQETSR